MALVAVAAALVAVLDPAALHGHRPAHPARTANAATAAATASAPVVPASTGSAHGPIRLPYVVRQAGGAKVSAAPAVVHIGARQVDLPRSWRVQSISLAGPGALVYVRVSAQGSDGPSLVAYVGPDGTVSPIPALAAGALPLTADGSLFVGRASDSGPLVLVQLPSGTVVDRGPALPSGYSIGGALGPRSILVEQDSTGADSIVDISTGVRTPVPQITQAWPVDAVSFDGQILLASAAGLRGIPSTAATGQAWGSDAVATQAEAGPEYSPDGSRIALVVDAQLLILSAADGSVLARSATLPEADSLGSLSWEDASTVLVHFADPQSGLTRALSRCGATYAQCSPLTPPAGHLLIAFR